MAKDQLSLEVDGKLTVKNVSMLGQQDDKSDAQTEHQAERLKNLHEEWRTVILTAFNRYLNIAQNQTRARGSGFINIVPYLYVLNKNQYADILMTEVNELAAGSEAYSPSVSQLYMSLGRKVQQRYQLEKKKRNGIMDKTEKLYDKYCEWMSVEHVADNPRQLWQRLMYHSINDGSDINVNEIEWTTPVLSSIGQFMYNILINDLRMDADSAEKERKPHDRYKAFYTIYRNYSRILREEVKVHPSLIK